MDDILNCTHRNMFQTLLYHRQVTQITVLKPMQTLITDLSRTYQLKNKTNEKKTPTNKLTKNFPVNIHFQPSYQ